MAEKTCGNFQRNLSHSTWAFLQRTVTAWQGCGRASARLKAKLLANEAIPDTSVLSRQRRNAMKRMAKKQDRITPAELARRKMAALKAVKRAA